MSACNGTTLKKMQFNGQKVKKWDHNGVRIFSAGNIVTYQVDSGTSYKEEVDNEASCLSPKTFTPTKSGWTFVGWRTDTAASSSVLSSKVMGEDPITLYAVFRQAVTVTYYNGSTTKQTTTGYRYYNNGNVVNPSFKLTQATINGWTARGWSASTAGNGYVTYSNGATFSRDSSITLYGMYYQHITLSYNGNGSTSGSVAAQTDARYYNSNGAVVNPTFTLRANGFARTDYAFTGWNLGAVGATVTLSASTTAYAQWTATALDVFNSGAYSGGVSSFKACYAFPNVRNNTTGSCIHREPALVPVSLGTTVSGSFAYVRGSVLTNVAVDLTGWNYITVYGSATSEYETYGACYLDSQTGQTIGDYDYLAGGLGFALNTKIDISSVAGKYFLGAYMACGSANSEDNPGIINITRIRLEK